MDVQGIIDAAVSHALSLGVFDRVNAHEPKHAPGLGMTAAVWVDRVEPVARASGLAATSAKLQLMVRVYTSANTEPADAIDPDVIKAVDLLMAAYTGDFTLGGLVMEVDLLGIHGTPLTAQAGYLRFGRSDVADGVLRVVTITVPCIVADAWTQSP